MNKDEARALLTAQRQELAARIEALEKTTTNRDEPLPAGFSEQATELEDRDVQEALVAESRDEMRQVNRALMRVDQGTYGTCETCGNEIAPARLQALPHATLCIGCAA